MSELPFEEDVAQVVKALQKDMTRKYTRDTIVSEFVSGTFADLDLALLGTSDDFKDERIAVVNAALKQMGFYKNNVREKKLAHYLP